MQNIEKQNGYWKELKINENMLMCSECGVMFNKNLIYDYTEKNILLSKMKRVSKNEIV